jgi:hypothetical protein
VIRLYTFDDDDRDMLFSLSASELDIQANILLQKRLHELQSILPNTFNLNKLDLSQSFLKYAESYWPEGYSKHRLDAIEFSHYLRNHKIHFDHAELNRLRFASAKRFFSVYVHRKLKVNGRSHFALQILYRFKFPVKELHLYLAF